MDCTKITEIARTQFTMKDGTPGNVFNYSNPEVLRRYRSFSRMCDTDGVKQADPELSVFGAKS